MSEEERRPPAPLADLFATAVHGYGSAWADMVVTTAVALAVCSVPVAAIDAAGASGQAKVALGTLAYAIGYFALLAWVTLRGLPARAPATRAAGAYVVALAAGCLAAAALVVLGPLAVVVLPLVLFAVPAAAAGDAATVAAIPRGALLAARHLARTWSMWLLSLLFAAAVWIGFALVVLPLASGPARFFATFALSAAIVWPFSALFVRALYGDLTGRLVVAPQDRTA